MRGRGTESRRRTAVRLMAAVSVALVAVGGCGSTGGRQAADESLRGTQLDQAQRLYSQLQREVSLQRDRKTLELAASLLDYYPTFPRNDEVLAHSVTAARRLEDPRRALDLTHELLGRYPQSALVEPALLQGAELAAGLGDTLAAAGLALRYHDRDPIRGQGPDGTPRSAVYIDRLDAGQIETLLRTYPQTTLRPYLGYALVRTAMAAGDYAVADRALEDLLNDAPEDRWSLAASELAGRQRGRGPRRVAGPVQADLVGVLCPLTGRYAVLGNAYYEAALLAVEDANSETGRTFRLHVEDTAGDPVAAALGARRICGEHGSIAVLGALMSDPTAAAALVTDSWGVPLVSPTATNDRIWELGDAIHQTNLTGFYEVRLLAQLASRVMLKRTFAIIHPDDATGRRHADVFADEIEVLGGVVVATEAFAPQGTDFRPAIMAVRERRPEVIFAPASVDQMILLGPQLDFYRAGSLVMGLSNWNSAKLAERSGTVLERAVFPDDFPLYPPSWSVAFDARWDADNYPREATELALKAYLATRMLLDTMAQSGATTRAALADALERRLSNRTFEASGPESFGRTARMFRDQKIVPFPAELFRESWQAAAPADSAAVTAPDSAAVNAATE